MARPIKEGLDYFMLDCYMNDKIRLIEAEYGVKGFAIIVKLFQKIYGERGYYCEWNEDVALLFNLNLGGNSGVNKNLIDGIVVASIRRGIFSQELYEKFGILTSKRIQEEYFSAVSRREKVEVKKEYLLVKVGKNSIYVDNNSINVNRNEENASNNTQSREEKSNKYTCASEMHNSQNDDKEEQLKKNFEVHYGLYPKKKGSKTVAYANYKLWVTTGKKVGVERHKLTDKQIYNAIKKYIRQQEESGQDDLQYWKNFETLMGRQLLDYVDWENE